MHAFVLVLRNAHMLHHTDVELTVFELNIIFFLAESFKLGTIGYKLDKSDVTMGHIICALYEKTGAGTHAGLVTFGFLNKFLKNENGTVAKGWENNDEVVWEWRKRKRGEKK
ncbi:MAG: hypothetical protein JJE25_00135 [Bacteroidia bacterium]|nr:hypothetical protein [Bacteroidia bacterium]